MERIVVYTAISGGVDDLKEPDVVEPGIDYVCLTDNPDLSSRVWKIGELPMLHWMDGDDVRRAKYPKVMPHAFFPEHDVSIWVDGSLKIRGNLIRFLADALGSAGLAVFRHPDGRESVADEFAACIRLRKDDPEVLSEQFDCYRLAGMPQDLPVAACAVIARRHHRPGIVRAMSFWWSEILAHSRRDQVSFPYMAWMTGLEYRVHDANIRDCEWFQWFPHKTGGAG